MVRSWITEYAFAVVKRRPVVRPRSSTSTNPFAMRYLLTALILFSSTLSACAPAGAVLNMSEERKAAEEAYIEQLMQKAPDTLTEEEVEYIRLHVEHKQAEDVEQIKSVVVATAFASLALFVIGTIALTASSNPDE